MGKDSSITKVIFRQFPDGEVIALFPELPGTIDPNTCLSYMHYGQHGSADTGIVRNTYPCDPQDYESLLKELVSIGYNLKIVKRFASIDHNTRRRGICE